MKFIIERKELVKALVLANSVVERNSTIPILNNVVLDASEGALRLTATDLDIQIRLAINAEVVTPGRISVAASMFHDIVRKMADGAQIECELVETLFQVKSGRSRMKTFTLPAEDFPDLDAGKAKTEFKLDSTELVRLIRKASIAVSTDESRFYLNGVYLHRRTDDLCCVGTDGHRLSLAWTAAPEGSGGLPGVIVPRKTAQLVSKHIDGYDGDIAVKVSENKISFEWGRTVLVSKLIDGSFPDYDRVVPKSNPNRASFEIKALATAVDRVSTVSSEKGRACRFTVAEGSMEVAMTVPDGGTAEDTVDISYTGTDMAIGFNARYVLDMLSNLDGARAIWDFGDPGSPSVLKPEGDENRHIAVLMPMRT